MEHCHLLQSVLWNHDESIPDALFARGHFQRIKDAVLLDGPAELSLNTYFNAFSAAAWRELTTVKRVAFRLRAKGSLRILLCCADEEGRESCVAAADLASAEALKEFTFGWFRPEDLGQLCWLKILTEESAEIRDIRVVTDAEPTRDVRLACCFCTFRREKDILRNVKALLAAGTDDNPGPDVYIADNGRSLKREDFGNSDRVFLFENKNYGGSGGFARCMIEAGLRKGGSYSHLILMDDDALILPAVVERTAALLSFLKPEYFGCLIGGALLSLQEPWLQVENGGAFAGNVITHLGYRRDLRDFAEVLRNQREAGDAEYNGWFYACLPASAVTETNLPLPFFLHGDDVEYGLRFQKRVLLLNGLCVWHPDPSTQVRPNIAYYDRRNFSVIRAENGKLSGALPFARDVLSDLMNMVSQYRYDAAHYTIRGYRDFLRGVDWLGRTDPEKLNDELRNWIPQEKIRVENPEEIALREPLTRPPGKAGKLKSILRPAKDGRAFYPMNTAWADIDYIGAKEIALVNPLNGEGILLRQNRREALAVLAESVGLAAAILLKLPGALRDWQENADKLKTLAFWTRYLGL